jgi:hypothetical protein
LCGGLANSGNVNDKILLAHLTPSTNNTADKVGSSSRQTWESVLFVAPWTRPDLL